MRKKRDNTLFHEWVLKWNIGPGMNDNRGIGKGPDVKNYSGFDGIVGPGWVPILDTLVSELVKLGWDRDLSQVKEKYGGLRFYTGTYKQEWDEPIRKAESACSKTCEECGKPGKLRGTGWVYTACDDCDRQAGL